MKKIVLIIGFLAMAVFQGAASGPESDGKSNFAKFYDKYKQASQVSAVYVSESLLSLASELDGFVDFDGVDINGTDVTALMTIGKLKGLYIVSSSWNDRARELNADIEKYINGDGRQYEELLRVRQDSEDAAMYYWSPDGVRVGEFLMVNKLVFPGNGQVFEISIIQFEAEDLKLSDLIKITLDIAKEN